MRYRPRRALLDKLRAACRFHRVRGGLQSQPDAAARNTRLAERKMSGSQVQPCTKTKAGLPAPRSSKARLAPLCIIVGMIFSPYSALRSVHLCKVKSVCGVPRGTDTFVKIGDRCAQRPDDLK